MDQKIENFLKRTAVALDLCQRDDHWSLRVSGWFMTDCGCCIIWRALSTGVAVGFLACSLLHFIILLWIAAG
jgi:hypothetical protein